MFKKLMAGVLLGIGLMAFAEVGASRDLYPEERMNAIDRMFVGDKNARIYHCDSCKEAQNVDPDNRIGFKTSKDAIEAGYRPCMRCKVIKN